MLVLSAVVGLAAPSADAPTTVAPSTTADAEDPLPAYPRTRIVIGISRDDPSVDPLELDQALRGQLADTGLRSEVSTLDPSGTKSDTDHSVRLAWAESQAAERDVLAVFWIEGSLKQRKLFLFEPLNGAIWVRALPRSSDPDEMIESLGTMVRGISLWLEAGPPSGMARLEPEPKPKPEPEPKPKPKSERPRPPPSIPPPPRPPGTAWGLGLAYAGGNLSNEAPWQSGASLSLDVEWPNHALVELSTAVMAPARLDSSPRTRVWRAPLALHAGYRFLPDRRVRPQVDGALVVEPLWWRSRDAPGVQAQSGRTARVAIAPGVGIRAHIVRGLGIGIHARLDLRLFDATLVVLQDGRRVPRLSPHRAAAFVRAGLHYTF